MKLGGEPGGVLVLQTTTEKQCGAGPIALKNNQWKSKMVRGGKGHALARRRLDRRGDPNVATPYDDGKYRPFRAVSTGHAAMRWCLPIALIVAFAPALVADPVPGTRHADPPGGNGADRPHPGNGAGQPQRSNGAGDRRSHATPRDIRARPRELSD